MYCTIRRYKIRKPQEFTEKVNESFINLVRTVPGFISYMAIDEGDGWWASISVFDTRDAMVQSDALAASGSRSTPPSSCGGRPRSRQAPSS